MNYDVLVSFTDPEDGNTVYWAGKDTYPRKGYSPGKSRAEYLLGNKNKFKRPVIAAQVLAEKESGENHG